MSFQGLKLWNEVNSKSLFLFKKILKRQLFSDGDTGGGGDGGR